MKSRKRDWKSIQKHWNFLKTTWRITLTINFSSRRKVTTLTWARRNDNIPQPINLKTAPGFTFEQLKCWGWTQTRAYLFMKLSQSNGNNYRWEHSYCKW